MLHERRALAAAILALYMFLYLNSWLGGPPPGWTAYLVALTGIYAVGFLGVVAGYFWARWYAIGLGIYGLVGGIIGVWTLGPEPVVLFLGGTHGAVSLALWGGRMSRLYDGQEHWRERFHLDETSTNRLGKSVIRIGFSLPIVVAYSLAPRPDAALVALTALAIGGLGLAGLGTLGLLRMRAWGIVALAGSALAVLSSTGVAAVDCAQSAGGGLPTLVLGGIVSVLMIACVAPFAGPCARFLRS